MSYVYSIPFQSVKRVVGVAYIMARKKVGSSSRAALPNDASAQSDSMLPPKASEKSTQLQGGPLEFGPECRVAIQSSSEKCSEFVSIFGTLFGRIWIQSKLQIFLKIFPKTLLEC